MTDSYDHAVLQYPINQDGTLASTKQSLVAAGTNPVSITVHSSGKYAYVANADSPGTVSQYTIGQDGSLTPMKKAKVATGEYAQSIALDPSGKHAYVANKDALWQYTISPVDGSLVLMNPAKVNAACGPSFITTVPGHK